MVLFSWQSKRENATMTQNAQTTRHAPNFNVETHVKMPIHVAKVLSVRQKVTAPFANVPMDGVDTQQQNVSNVCILQTIA